MFYVYCLCVVRARQTDHHARFDGGPVVPASRTQEIQPCRGAPYRGTRVSTVDTALQFTV